MRNYIKVILIFLLGLGLACKKKDNPAPDEKANKPMPTEHGTTIGNAVRKTIGPEGGSIESAEGDIKLVIPPGAVDANINFSVQQVNKTLAMGVGNSYRLTPENVQFKKDIELSFKYAENQLVGTSPEFLYLAYQDEKGYWHAALDSELLPYNNIVKVKTRHFSDWTISTRLVMTSSKDSLKMGEVAILKVSYQTISEPLKDNDDLLAPELVINPEKVVAWDLTGEGKLTSAKNETAVYKAPVNIQKRSVVTVSVTLKDIWKEFWKPKAGQPTESYVFKDLALVPDEYFYWDINGFTFESEPENLLAQFDGNANYSISGRTGNETYRQYLWAAIVGKDKGIRNFRNPEINDDNYVYVELLYTGLPLFSRYQCNNIKTSTIGNMIIKSIGGKGDYLEGTIKGELATEDKCNPVKRPLTARFRLKIK